MTGQVPTLQSATTGGGGSTGLAFGGESCLWKPREEIQSQEEIEDSGQGGDLEECSVITIFSK